MLVAGAVLSSAGLAHAFSGEINYTGALGPINANRPLCLCVYTMPDLTNRIGCAIYRRNEVTYDPIVLADRDYYLIAFVDIHINERRDADEPYLIFEGRGGTPADPLNGKSMRDDIDFIFGDENLVESDTPTPSETPLDTVTPSVTPTATDTPVTPTVPAGQLGDCDGDGAVTVDELVRAVAIALESQPLSSCPAADRDGDGVVRIDEVIAAIGAALS